MTLGGLPDDILAKCLPSLRAAYLSRFMPPPPVLNHKYGSGNRIF